MLSFFRLSSPICQMLRMADFREPLTDEDAERMERGLRRLLNTPPQPHGKSPTAAPPKRKTRPGSKGRVRKAKSRS
jgi:hypothetical protein